MDYSIKLTTERYRTSTVGGRNFNEEMESDRGRALTSAALRRLQQKTQVFPLEKNAAVRSRLTHSLEVQQVGRYISKLVLSALPLSECGLNDKVDGFISAVEIACLLHDIGNPPFGHFGEMAINIWSKEKVIPIFNEIYHDVDDYQKIIQDIINFEGNAQGIRILHSLHSLNLTYTQLACLIKYTRPAYQPKSVENLTHKYRWKKPGFFLSEETLINNIQSELSITAGCRFPLTYIMEAADDISYCIADLDDAVDKGILSIDKLHGEINRAWDDLKVRISDETQRNYLNEITTKAYQSYQNTPTNKNHAYILTLRTILVNDLAKYAAERFIIHHQSIFNGELDESLLDGDDKYHFATETLRLVSINNVFNSKEVEKLELKGYSVISGLLDLYTPLIKISFEEIRTLTQKNHLKSHPIETRLFHNLPEKYRTTYSLSTKDIFEATEVTSHQKLYEHYYRVRLIIDYISGMTDHFALKEYQDLSASI
ncbi:dGTPase [Aeromonas piscicola]|uniref:dGTPase n=1 Tax=Aeromonas piscicola TaxID=600645 RepID=UPI0021F8901C|nr:dGTPase [Aeromonas piscicola]MCW0505968.1 dGTPase [Aeromonas piscicola]